MRVVFMGSPEFAVPSLRELIAARGIEVVGVFSQPPRPAGRGQKEQKTPVHQLAEAHGIPVFTPTKLDEPAQAELKALKADVICVAAYGLLLPEAVVNSWPCVNVHPSALPRWRGAAPLQRAILAGDKTLDVCIMKMQKGLDDGPVYLRKPYEIGANETAGELTERMAEIGAKHLVEVLDGWDDFKENARPQKADGVTYAHKFKSEDLPTLRKIDFNETAESVHNQIRGLSPWPGATATIHGEEIKLLKSTLSEEKADVIEAGKISGVSKIGVSIACGTGQISVPFLQRKNKKALPAEEFLKGFPLQVGEQFS